MLSTHNVTQLLPNHSIGHMSNHNTASILCISHPLFPNTSTPEGNGCRPSGRDQDRDQGRDKASPNIDPWYCVGRGGPLGGGVYGTAYTQPGHKRP